MLSGFNTNFRYRGVLFHVQTEDSGLENPHVITHLFHGGNIMVSEKKDYSDLLAGDALEENIKKLMEGQHKKILKQLSRGEHDATIGERLGPDIFLATKRDESEVLVPPSVTEEERPPSPGRSVSATPSTPSAPPASADRRATRPAVAEPTVLGRRPPSPTDQPAAQETTAALSKVFGDRVVSEKPLDEVVLDYLVENARKRRRQPK